MQRAPASRAIQCFVCGQTSFVLALAARAVSVQNVCVLQHVLFTCKLYGKRVPRSGDDESVRTTAHHRHAQPPAPTRRTTRLDSRSLCRKPAFSIEKAGVDGRMEHVRINVKAAMHVRAQQMITLRETTSPVRLFVFMSLRKRQHTKSESPICICNCMRGGRLARNVGSYLVLMIIKKGFIETKMHGTFTTHSSNPPLCFALHLLISNGIT